jgi:hypothetical protein
VVSDPVGEAVENLHPADGMLDRYAGLGMLPVMFFLGGGQFGVRVFLGFPGPFMRQVYFGFRALIVLRPLEPEVGPHIHCVKPFGLGVEYLFHERVVVDAAGDEAEEEKDWAAQGRDGCPAA